MIKIKLIEMGYFHPSNANWNYHIFMIIDRTGARLYKATFGGEQRIKIKDKLLFERVAIGHGSDTVYKGRTVAKLPNIEYYNGRNWPK